MRHSVSNAIQDAPDILRSGEGAILAPDFDDLRQNLLLSLSERKETLLIPSDFNFGWNRPSSLR